MHLSKLFLAALVIFAASSCDNNKPRSEDTQGAETDTSGNPDISIEPDQAAPDVTDLTEDDFTPGCVGDLCVAGPDSAPDPREFGPFPVGVMTFETSLYDHKDKYRTLTVDVHYPATEAFRGGPFVEIDLLTEAPEDVKPLMPTTSNLNPIITQMVRDAELRIKDGPFPMVIFSHGAFGVRFQNVFLTQYMASHGYIVVCPDHVGNTLYDMIKAGGYSLDPVIESAFDRPLDVTHLIDLMLKWNTTPGHFYLNSIDPERIGITGHSFGGYTSFLQAFDDERIKAILPMAPATQQLVVFGYDLSEFPVPAMVMAGTLDNTLETDKDMTAAYEKMPAPKYYFELKRAGHYSFTDICSLDLKALADEIGFGDAEDALTDGCGDFNVPVDYAHPLIRQFGIGFFNYYLRDSENSKVYFDATAAIPHEKELIFWLQE
jgi:predicted dienelactone hydrolase